jgi:hypothetical protein
MSEKKVVPIRTRHKTFQSLASQAVIADEAVRGAMIYFEEASTMHFGEFGLRRADVAMMHAYTTMLAVEMMQQED